MSKKQYWQGLEQINPTQSVTTKEANEFQESLPFEDTTGILDAQTPRRDFLKYLGFSTAAAMLAASCEIPVRKAITWGIKPNDITPGVPLLYASSFVDAGEVVPVIVKTRDARPIKIEGNKDGKIMQGGTSARVQASVLSLYDVARLKQPMIAGKATESWADVDAAVAKAMAATAGKPIYLVSSTINSNTDLELIAKFTAKYPTVKHIMYDAISYSGLLDAAASATGKRAIPTYHFDIAKTIVSIGADFLGTWLSPTENAKSYSKGRKISKTNLTMSKHYQIEGNMSITGGSADVRVTARPSEYSKVAVALLGALSGTAPTFASKNLNATITKAATDLKAGGGLVVCGSNDKATQEVVFAINAAVGAIGTTVNTAVSNLSKKGNDTEMSAFVASLLSGGVGGVLFADCNPVYEMANGAEIAKAIKALPLSVSFNDRNDETTQHCNIVAPVNHWLESWGAFEYRTGYVSLQQPTINQLFKTRPMGESLLRWTGDATTSYADYYSASMKSKLGGDAGFDAALQLGVIEPATMAIGGGYSGSAAAAIASIASAPTLAGDEIVVYQKVAIGHGGIWSNNPWLQELPDPVTKCTWDNYIAMSPKRAKELGAEQTDINEVQTGEKKVMTITVGKTTMELPVAVVPGMHDNVIAVAVGYGRSNGVGNAAKTDDFQGGKNGYLLTANAGGNTTYSQAVKIAKTDKIYSLAITQTHHSYEGRDTVVKETTFAKYVKNPDEIYNERMHELHHYITNFDEAADALEPKEEEHGAHAAVAAGAHAVAGAHSSEAKHTESTSETVEAHEVEGKQHGEGIEGHDVQKLYAKNGTLYPVYESPGLKWGMSIDLNSCTGCGACSVACQAENNVSVVGKKQVLKVHDMHWLRIDRYYTSTNDNQFDSDSIQTMYMPMMCQHCDNAPCENVCPVNASNHSSEGVNQMAYNRCIGTRYCANNCPFKVRRFNWRDWNGADSFADNLYEDGFRDDVNSDLTRMVLNPDVTVRGRGVIEKCSMCAQRTQAAKTKAKQENRVLADGDAVSACAQACPTNAIVFGNVNDHESEIYKVRNSNNKERLYYALEELHILPNVNYLYKVRNTELAGAPEEELEGAHKPAGAKEEHKEHA
jgi:MoCo/4Fe-4S cofactor protein with predicted Tat translocation signal